MHRRRKLSKRVCGFVFYELIILLVLISLVLVGLLGLFSTDGTSPYSDVTPYRWANALYARSQLESFRGAVLSYYDMVGGLPGDAPHGNGNGIIEKDLREDAYVLSDLHEAGVLPSEAFFIRGRRPDLFHTVLEADGRVLGQGHFIKLSRFNNAEAVALDRKFDDSRSDSGDIIFANTEDDEVDLYVKLVLY